MDSTFNERYLKLGRTPLRIDSKAAGNSTYPKGGVSCFADTFVQVESSVLRTNFSAKNPALRVATNR